MGLRLFLKDISANKRVWLLRQFDNLTMEQFGNGTMNQFDNVTMEQFGNGTTW